MGDERAIEVRAQDIHKYNFDLYETKSGGEDRVMVAAVQMERAFQVTNIRDRLEGGSPGDYLVVDVDRPANIMVVRERQFNRGYKLVEQPKQTKSKPSRRRR